MYNPFNGPRTYIAIQTLFIITNKQKKSHNFVCAPEAT